MAIGTVVVSPAGQVTSPVSSRTITSQLLLSTALVISIYPIVDVFSSSGKTALAEMSVKIDIFEVMSSKFVRAVCVQSAINPFCSCATCFHGTEKEGYDK